MSTGHEQIHEEFPGQRPGRTELLGKAHASAASRKNSPPLQHPKPVGPEWEEAHSPTLFHLIEAVAEVTNCDQEIVATVSHMLNSGRVLFRRQAQDPHARWTFGHA